MSTIGSNVDQKEFDAMAEYANLCGETVSNVIRKVLIVGATMLSQMNIQSMNTTHLIDQLEIY